jgi:Uma2 family endonuclease
MSTLLPIDARITPRSLRLDPPMTDAEFEKFCFANDVARIERTREGVIQMNPPAGSFSSDGNSEIGEQLRTWWKTHRRGRVYDSNGGFYLADGSMLSPDASYLTAERLAPLTRQDRLGFPHVCPDFVIELLSESDRLRDAKQKMERWIENGAQLGWLIDPYKRVVHIYRPGSVSVSGKVSVVGEGPVAGFTLQLNDVWECYEL